MTAARYELKICSSCGAGNTPVSPRCYLCGEDLQTAGLVEMRPATASEQISYHWINVAMAAVLLVVLIGLTLSAPPLGIALAVVLVPMFVIVVVINPRKAAARIGLTLLIVAMVCVMAVAAAYIALLIACSGFHMPH